jgi:hypothetical protein
MRRFGHGVRSSLRPYYTGFKGSAVSRDVGTEGGLSLSAGASDVLEFLAGLPSPEETLALRPTPALETRVKNLLEKSRTSELSPAEEEEWQRYEYIEHLVRLAKAKAALKLRPQ